MTDNEKVRFNTDSLVKQLKNKYPENKNLIKKLSQCKFGVWVSPSYISFVENEILAEDVFVKDSVHIEEENGHTVIIDILSDGRIQGIEFWRLLPKRSERKKERKKEE